METGMAHRGEVACTLSRVATELSHIATVSQSEK